MALQEQQIQRFFEVLATSKLPSELEELLAFPTNSHFVVIQQGLDDALKVSIPKLRGSLGNYNIATNTPTISDGSGIDGDSFIVTVSGSRDFGSGTVKVSKDDVLTYRDGRWLNGGYILTKDKVVNALGYNPVKSVAFNSDPEVLPDANGKVVLDLDSKIVPIKEDISDLEDEINNIEIPEIVDALNSTFADKALSANQGRVIKGFIDDINVFLNGDDVDLDQIKEIADFIKQNRDDLDHLTISNIAGLPSALDDKEDKFSKNTAFNKNFGTGQNDVMPGNFVSESDKTKWDNKETPVGAKDKADAAEQNAKDYSDAETDHKNRVIKIDESELNGLSKEAIAAYIGSLTLNGKESVFVEVDNYFGRYSLQDTTDADIKITTEDGQPYTIDWGDGTIESVNSGVTKEHTYSSPYSGEVKVYDNYTIHRLEINKGGWNFDVSDLPIGLTDLRLSGNLIDVSGTVTDLPSGLTTLYLNGNLIDVSGQLSDLPSGLTYLYLKGNLIDVSGTVTDLPSGLTYLYLSGNLIDVSGQLSDLPSGLTTLYLIGDLIDVSGTVSGISINNRFYYYTSDPYGFNSSEVDSLLIVLAENTWVGSKQIVLTGSNAPRTSASDAAVDSLIAQGVSVTTNN